MRPLVAFFFEEPVEDEKAWRKTMKEDAPRVLEAVTAALDRLDDSGFDSVEAALSPLPTFSASSRARSTSRSGSRSPAPVSRASSKRSRSSARKRPFPASGLRWRKQVNPE